MHALSFPTWMVHISSVLEWAIAIWLIWSRGTQWQPLSLGMMPALISALCACTWHFFDNATSLEWLVEVQAATTLVGNGTLAYGAYRLCQGEGNSPLSP
ncbi:MAG: DUF2499 domain-containing protein [Oscillatoriales cyanobacterium SM2_2_1]|nr:DUF2499 domain-containing protein [Oscillatoriales cyanobacterium SM2_2_1]